MALLHPLWTRAARQLPTGVLLRSSRGLHHAPPAPSPRAHTSRVPYLPSLSLARRTRLIQGTRRSGELAAELKPGNFTPGDKSAKAPLFLLHDLTGVVGHVLPVAKSMKTPCCLVQQTPMTPNQGDLPDTIAHYCDAIESLQPEGALNLGGYSRGGQFAYEAALVLQARGRQVRSIVSIDGGAFDRYILLEGKAGAAVNGECDTERDRIEMRT